MNFFLGSLVLLLLLLSLWLARRGQGAPPASREALLARVFGRILAGERESVLEEMRGLYQRSDQDVGVGLALGMLFRHMGKNQVAIRTHQSLASHPNLDRDLKAMIYTELSADYLASGLLDRAHATFEQAMAYRKPDERLTRIGERVLVGLKDWDAAFRLVQEYGKHQGAAVAERLGILRFEKGEHLWREELHAEAFVSYKKAVAVHAHCLPAHLACCRYFRHIGKPEKALKWLQKHGSRFQEYEWLAMEETMKTAMALGDHGKFLDAVEQRLEEKPEDWRTRIVLARFLMETGSQDQAVRELLACLDREPHMLAIHQMFWALLVRGDRAFLAFQKYQSWVRENLVFQHPYECRACHYQSHELLWLCPSCHRAYSFGERKI